MINNKLLRNLDCTLIGVTVLLNIISIIMIGSATHVNSIAEDRYWYMQRQGIFFLVKTKTSKSESIITIEIPKRI